MTESATRGSRATSRAFGLDGCVKKTTCAVVRRSSRRAGSAARRRAGASSGGRRARRRTARRRRDRAARAHASAFLELRDPLAERVRHGNGLALVERDAHERRPSRSPSACRSTVVVDAVGGVVVRDARRPDALDPDEDLEQVVEARAGVVLDGRPRASRSRRRRGARGRGGGGTRSARGRSTACSGRSRRRPARRCRRTRRVRTPRTETAACRSRHVPELDHRGDRNRAASSRPGPAEPCPVSDTAHNVRRTIHR